MNTALDFSHSKNFFNFFPNHWNILPFLMSWYIWGEKVFFKTPNQILLTVKKFFKPFDKFPVVKFFKIIYHTTVTMFLLSLAKLQLLLLSFAQTATHIDLYLALFKSCYIVTQQNMSAVRFSLHAYFYCLCNGFFVFLCGGL